MVKKFCQKFKKNGDGDGVPAPQNGDGVPAPRGDPVPVPQQIDVHPVAEVAAHQPDAVRNLLQGRAPGELEANPFGGHGPTTLPACRGSGR